MKLFLCLIFLFFSCTRHIEGVSIYGPVLLNQKQVHIMFTKNSNSYIIYYGEAVNGEFSDSRNVILDNKSHYLKTYFNEEKVVFEFLKGKVIKSQIDYEKVQEIIEKYQ